MEKCAIRLPHVCRWSSGVYTFRLQRIHRKREFSANTLHLYSWLKPKCWLKAIVFCVSYVIYLCSVIVCRHESGRCRIFLLFSSFESEREGGGVSWSFAENQVIIWRTEIILKELCLNWTTQSNNFRRRSIIDSF